MRIALLAILILLLIGTAEASTIVVTVADFKPIVEAVDRKSTGLNSSH